ncbi:unnamed protein product [Closterium sp. Naga37s-1]|nr:unnamed protein product [Closterium sp. Naga37s-1]
MNVTRPALSLRAPCPIDACALTRRCARPAFAVVPPAPCPLFSSRAPTHFFVVRLPRLSRPTLTLSAHSICLSTLLHLSSLLLLLLTSPPHLLLPLCICFSWLPPRTHAHPLSPQSTPSPPSSSPLSLFPSTISPLPPPPFSPHMLRLVANCGPPCPSVKSPPFSQSSPSPSSASPLSLQFPLHYLTPSSTSFLSSSAAAGS